MNVKTFKKMQLIFGTWLNKPTLFKSTFRDLKRGTMDAETFLVLFEIMVKMDENGKIPEKGQILSVLMTNEGIYPLAYKYFIESKKMAEICRFFDEEGLRKNIQDANNEVLREKIEEAYITFIHEPDTEKAINSLRLSLESMQDESTIDSTHHISESIHRAMKASETALALGGEISGIPSGIVELDRLTDGWQKSNLVIMAGRPGQGKTATAVQICKAAAESGVSTLLFELEMASQELGWRFIGNATATNTFLLKKGAVDFKHIHANLSQVSDLPIFIDDTANLSLSTLITISRKYSRMYDLGLIIIDYLQLIQVVGQKKGFNREQEVGNISRTLKGLAKELNIPVIALAQLSRAVETRGGDKRPILSDLRDSGQIEMDADLVIFNYRPEYYNITEDESGNSTSGLMELIISKHRGGSVGIAKTGVDLSTNRFYNFEEHRNLVENKSFIF